MKKNIPNFITGLNLLTGLAGIYFCSKENLLHASYAIFLAMVFDFLDGMFARALKSGSDFGKQFDSLADLVSFGIVPGFMVFHLLNSQNQLEISFINKDILPFLGFIIPLASAIRLAKFNIDTRQTNSFYGLPTPAHALFWASIPILINFNKETESNLSEYIVHPVFIIASTVIFSFMMLSNIKMIALKFKNLKFSDNWQRYILIGVIIVLFAIVQVFALPLIIIVYVVLSLLFMQFNR